MRRSGNAGVWYPPHKTLHSFWHRRRFQQLLRAGYEEMAAHDLELVREFEHVDRDTPWPEYAE